MAKYRTRTRPRKPPSQTWKTFLKNHAGTLASMDFFVVPTATFRLLYVFVLLRHAHRRVVHVNVTTRPTAAWVAHQLRQAFPFETAPRYLIRDRDGIYGRGASLPRRIAYRGSGHGAAFALAKSLLRASDRLDPPRAVGSCHRPQREIFATALVLLSGLLSSGTSAHGVGSQCTRAACGGGTRAWPSHRRVDGGRTTSPIPSLRLSPLCRPRRSPSFFGLRPCSDCRAQTACGVPYFSTLGSMGLHFLPLLPNLPVPRSPIRPPPSAARLPGRHFQ